VILFIARRLLWAVVILVGLSMVVFVIMYIIPADPAHMIAGPRASREALEAIRHELGLDQPLVVQYGRYLANLVHGNLGQSWRTNREVSQILIERLPATALLALGGLLVQLFVGLPIGLLSALKQGGWVDRVGMLFSLLFVAVPGFWLGLILLYLFAYRIPIFPLGGYGGLRYLVLPAFTLGIAGAAWYARLFRSTVLDVLHADYVRTARAKGLQNRTILLRHVVRNSIIPVLTMLGMDLGTFLSGVVVIETVYAWPGIGLQAWQALRNLDIPVILGTVLFAGTVMTLSSLVIDISYALVDPRIRYHRPNAFA
jgi:peptide/nickel transport system permease protein